MTKFNNSFFFGKHTHHDSMVHEIWFPLFENGENRNWNHSSGEFDKFHVWKLSLPSFGQTEQKYCCTTRRLAPPPSSQVNESFFHRFIFSNTKQENLSKHMLEKTKCPFLTFLTQYYFSFFIQIQNRKAQIKTFNFLKILEGFRKLLGSAKNWKGV